MIKKRVYQITVDSGKFTKHTNSTFQKLHFETYASLFAVLVVSTNIRANLLIFIFFKRTATDPKEMKVHNKLVPRLPST